MAVAQESIRNGPNPLLVVAIDQSERVSGSGGQAVNQLLAEYAMKGSQAATVVVEVSHMHPVLL